MAYNVKVDGLVTGAVANTYKTLVGLKMANTAGHRGRLRKLVIGGSGGAAQDIQVDVRVRRTDNTGDGTSTSVNVNTIGKDPEQIASVVSAMGKNYSAPPTTFETASVAGGQFNSHGSLVLEWAPGEGPQWGKNQTLAIEAAPGVGTATNLSLDLEWDEGQ